MKEPLLEPLLRRMRIHRVLPHIRTHQNCRLLDVGCGWDARFLRSVAPYIKEGVGIDFKAPKIQEGKIRTEKLMLIDSLPYQDASFDIVTMLAVLEHLDHPEALLHEILRVLAPEGCLVLTVPSKLSQPVLEFLAFRVGLVSPVEISDHKAYYDKRSLKRLLARIGFKETTHHYFQAGMNNFCVAKR